MLRCLLLGVVVGVVGFTPSLALAIDYPGRSPGQAVARQESDRLVLENAGLAATWTIDGQRITAWKVNDRNSGRTLQAPEVFGLTLADGHTVKASDLRLVGRPSLEKLAPQPDAVRLAERDAGWKAAAELVSADGTLRVHWTAFLRDQANSLRQEVTLQAEGNDLPAGQLALIDLETPEAQVQGSVEGSPVAVGSLFLACEHPMAANRVEKGRVVCSVATFGPLRAGQPVKRSSVIGVAPAGQLRRAFLYYLERERPRPYRPFLHYNSWYDIAWHDRKMNEELCLAAIEVLGDELLEKRHGTLDSLVFDDGWDDNRTLWRFHPGFPRGFTPLQQAAAKYHSAVGVWLSPWGGYAQAKKERLQYGKTQGFETNRNGFSLAGPKYYGRFRDVCEEMITKYGVNYFKFDGIAQGISSAGAGQEFAADVEAMLRLIDDLRRLRPDLFVNVTTGTWPSPFWLMHGDSIWRNGNDMGFAGDGSARQRWITYRDMITYQWIVRRGPLYPLNSLMTQGICHAKLGDPSKLSPDAKEWADETRSFFGSGTQLQELYVTPQMLTPEMWDTLAEGANWSRRNFDVLADSHWIGGDPGQKQVYGFAAWSPRQGILTLRNPSPSPATIALDIGQAFELPADAPQAYRLASPWKQSTSSHPLALQAGKPHTFKLASFEVQVFEAVPER